MIGVVEVVLEREFFHVRMEGTSTAMKRSLSRLAALQISRIEQRQETYISIAESPAIALIQLSPVRVATAALFSTPRPTKQVVLSTLLPSS